jgi:hypothetical protein
LGVEIHAEFHAAARDCLRRRGEARPFIMHPFESRATQAGRASWPKACWQFVVVTCKSASWRVLLLCLQAGRTCLGTPRSIVRLTVACRLRKDIEDGRD